MKKLDSTLVNSLKGKTLLVGLTFCDRDGSLLEQKQFFGTIQDITESEVIVRNPRTGEELSLPPDLSAYSKAEPGIYRLRSTGEEAENPNLIGSWTITKPSH